MRIKLYFELENNILNVDYHKNILSFFKKAVQDYGMEYFQELYKEGENIIKPYTFAVFFPKPKFKQDTLELEKPSFNIIVSIENYRIGTIIYNSFNRQRNKLFQIRNNSMKLRDIDIITEKDNLTENITIKFLSPLMVRDRNRETRKDYYYSFNHEKFKEALKINIGEQLKISNLSKDIVETFDIRPISARKTVVKFYEKQIEVSLGTFELSGDKTLLEYLYKAGIGARRSSGFGLFEII